MATELEHRGNPDGTEVYVQELPKCDFCAKPAFYDGATRMGPWAHMCEEHFKMHGIGLGTGKGQKLIPRKALGEAEKIRGEPEKELSVTMTEADLEVATFEDVWYPECPYCGAKTPAEPDAHAVYCQACNRRFRIINPFFSSGNPEVRAEKIAKLRTELETLRDEVYDRLRGVRLSDWITSPESPGIVINEERAKATPCKCFAYKGKDYCYSPGIIGMLEAGQVPAYCPTRGYEVRPGIKQRFEEFAEAAEAAEKKIEEIPKGERLIPWLTEMGKELRAKGIEV